MAGYRQLKTSGLGPFLTRKKPGVAAEQQALEERKPEAI